MQKQIRITVLVAAFVLISPVLVRAQWSIVGTPPWTSTSIQTTGGITYFLHSATLPACYAVETAPVNRSGTNFSLTVAKMFWNGPCIFCYDCYHTQTTATVLGNLAPGAYRLWIYSYPFYDPLDPFPPSPSLWQIRDFQVPGRTGTTLELSGSTNEMRVCLRGVPAAAYVLECSTNLLDWVCVRTNTGGPCTFTNSISADAAKFFRTRVLSGSVNTIIH